MYVMYVVHITSRQHEQYEGALHHVQETYMLRQGTPRGYITTPQQGLFTTFEQAMSLLLCFKAFPYNFIIL